MGGKRSAWAKVPGGGLMGPTFGPDRPMRLEDFAQLEEALQPEPDCQCGHPAEAHDGKGCAGWVLGARPVREAPRCAADVADLEPCACAEYVDAQPGDQLALL